MSDTAILRQLGQALTAPGRDKMDVLAEAAALCELMERRSTLPSPAGTTLGQGSTLLDSGLALSPAEAALCARQPLRTIVFIRAVLAAIETAAATAAGPVRVLYAGCGPYAPLALPLMALLGPQRAVFTLLDIHAESLRHVRALVGGLGLDACVDACVQADATRHRIDPARPPHVIVSETMNAALRTEPQVAIARHLAGQAPDALLVPERVIVSACLLDPAAELTPPLQPGAPVPPLLRDRIDLGPRVRTESRHDRRLARHRGRHAAGGDRYAAAGARAASCRPPADAHRRLRPAPAGRLRKQPESAPAAAGPPRLGGRRTAGVRVPAGQRAWSGVPGGGSVNVADRLADR
jgi:hypothetical protein